MSGLSERSPKNSGNGLFRFGASETSLAVISETNLYLIDPSDAEAPVTKTIPLGSRGADRYRPNLSYDRSGQYLYWPKTQDTSSEYSIARNKFSDLSVGGYEIVPDEKKDRSIIYCSPCGIFDVSKSSKTPLGLLPFEPGEYSELNVEHGDGNLLIAKSKGSKVTGISIFWFEDDGMLRHPRQMFLEDQSVKAHRLMSCRAADTTSGFLVCRYSADSETGDGLIIWTLPEEGTKTTSFAGRAEAITAGKQMIVDFQTWHDLEKPFGK